MRDWPTPTRTTSSASSSRSSTGPRAEPGGAAPTRSRGRARRTHPGPLARRGGSRAGRRTGPVALRAAATRTARRPRSAGSAPWRCRRAGSTAVLPHEDTYPVAVEGRRALLAATATDLEPIVLAHDPEPVVAELTDRARQGPPTLDAARHRRRRAPAVAGDRSRAPGRPDGGAEPHGAPSSPTGITASPPPGPTPTGSPPLPAATRCSPWSRRWARAACGWTRSTASSRT